LLGNVTGNHSPEGYLAFTDQALWFIPVKESSYFSECFQVVQNKNLSRRKRKEKTNCKDILNCPKQRTELSANLFHFSLIMPSEVKNWERLLFHPINRRKIINN
jgi:hypothetical protein